MRILLLHRKGEANGTLLTAKSKILKAYPNSSVVFLCDDRFANCTNHIPTWLRSCATGYDLEGHPRFDIFVIASRWVDSEPRMIWKLAKKSGKPFRFFDGNKTLSVSGVSKPDESGLSEIQLQVMA